MLKVDTHALAREFAVVTVEDTLVISMFRRTPKLLGVQVSYDICARAVVSQPSGVAFLTVAVDPGAPPDAPTRAIFNRQLAEYEGVSVGSAVLTMGGSPLATSVVRGVMTSLLVLSRHKTPIRMFGDAMESLLWLEGLAKARGLSLASPSEVETLLHEISGQMLAAPAAA